MPPSRWVLDIEDCRSLHIEMFDGFVHEGAGDTWFVANHKHRCLGLTGDVSDGALDRLGPAKQMVAVVHGSESAWRRGLKRSLYPGAFMSGDHKDVVNLRIGDSFEKLVWLGFDHIV